MHAEASNHGVGVDSLFTAIGTRHLNADASPALGQNAPGRNFERKLDANLRAPLRQLHRVLVRITGLILGSVIRADNAVAHWRQCRFERNRFCGGD